MKKLLLAISLTLGMASTAHAGGITGVASRSTPFRITASVFNDSGGALTSGSVVIWDTGDTEFENSGQPYVTTTATADHDWVAGVTLNDSCADQSMCEIVVYGPAITRVAAASESGFTEDTTLSTGSVAGQAGDWDGGANECSLGLLMDDDDAYNNGAALNQDNQSAWVFVNISCED